MDHVFVNKFNWQLNNKTIKNNSLRPFVLWKSDITFYYDIEKILWNTFKVSYFLYYFVCVCLWQKERCWTFFMSYSLLRYGYSPPQVIYYPKMLILQWRALYLNVIVMSQENYLLSLRKIYVLYFIIYYLVKINVK